MSMFTNPNVQSIVVDRVPCAFAKSKDGTTGTHYAMVLFDKNQNVMYVGSECEHIHGPGVQALHEMSDGNSPTCFKVTDAFSKALNQTKAHHMKKMHPYGAPNDLKNNSQLIQSALKMAWERTVSVHNKRYAALPEVEYSNNLSAKEQMMQRAINRVTQRYLNIPLLFNNGRKSSNLQHPPQISEVVRPQIFTLRSRVLSYDMQPEGMAEPIPAGQRILGLHPAEDESVMWAVRTENTDWQILHYRIRECSRNVWAGVAGPGNIELNDNGVTFRQLMARKNRDSHQRQDHCVFCGKSFDRITRHLQSRPHQDAVKAAIEMACRASSPVGLRMLNNRRFSSIFQR